ncbi:MAG: class I tRNA ligase family protein [Candidatus Pacebacteria bacterium]|nr:class I tRNA ligase family protein [Candidatus Paceibacterota bacterium]
MEDEKINLEKVYNPQKSEQKIYEMWEKGGYFTAKADTSKRPFSIIMPPANANGSLHVGHALGTALQDIMIRYHRMKGDSALWLPGSDHAGFETQVVYDKKLEKEGKHRGEIPKGQLLKDMLEFTLQNKKVMEGQLKKLGASCDWSRNKFTLDPEIIKIVYSTFEKLKADGLIYKGSRLVNWCTKHQTSLSDLEVKYEERTDPLYYIQYGPFKLATVRPETKFGDTAIAVNPKDKRYEKYVGKEIEVETVLGKAKIKVIADDSVDMKFGTGAVKVTPAHDFTDYETWQKHKNEIPGPKIVIDKYGKMNELAGPYKNMKVLEAREKVVQDMIKKGLLNEKDTDRTYKHNVAICYKCGTAIEPTLMENQWFVKMTDPPAGRADRQLSLRDLAVEAVKKGEIKFVPARFEKIFLQWMENLRDWNISRQIPWGIKIPEEKTEEVFDTWFSSGQWPFATLQTTQRGDFEYFYPTAVMETAADIIFFWVARMVMLGIYTTGKVPFKYVYLHGLVRDKDKQKMSKSKGNVIDPLGVVDLHGADALRMALVFANSPGQDIAFSEEKIIAQRRFANKIWNAARFVLTQNSKNQESRIKNQVKPKTIADKEILKSLEQATKEISKDIESFQFHEAAQKIYHFFWHTFCDIYIEKSKEQIANSETADNTKQILLYVLRESLKLLHPFMPFITEQIYQMLPNKEREALVIESWPR